MRSAAKVAGIGVLNTGIRGGISAVRHPAEQSVRNASRPVSEIISYGKAGGPDAAEGQRPSWELDECEFTGGEEELLLDSGESVPRVVFGGAPSLQEEAKEATAQVKDALEKVYRSSPTYMRSGGLLHDLFLVTSTDKLETKSCIINEPKAAPTSNYAIQAFALLDESPAAQSVYASIVSDPKVLDAVLKNEALTEFLQFHETNDASSEAGNPETGVVTILENIKLTVVEMASNVSTFVHKIFGGFSSEQKISEASGGNVKPSVIETLGASFMALAVMVIMVVVLKRV